MKLVAQVKVLHKITLISHFWWLCHSNQHLHDASSFLGCFCVEVMGFLSGDASQWTPMSRDRSVCSVLCSLLYISHPLGAICLPRVFSA